jgi:hypothetical protein
LIAKAIKNAKGKKSDDLFTPESQTPESQTPESQAPQNDDNTSN